LDNIVRRELWEEWRAEAFKRFKEDILIGYADEDIVDLIEEVFRSPHCFTTSSCSGRITAIDAPYPWLREGSEVLFKKHSPMTPDELATLINTPVLTRLWIVVSGPILHVVTDSVDEALKLLKTVRAEGFKHSGVISMSSSGVVVEVISGVWLSLLIRDRNALLIKTSSLTYLNNLINQALGDAKKRLARLKKLFFEKRVCWN